jgi:hypothetical protein
MTYRKQILIIAGILSFCLSVPFFYGNSQIKKEKTDETEVRLLAKFISDEGGDKIHFSKFQILKNLSGSELNNDTITVGYYFYKAPTQHFDTVLLTLSRYKGSTNLKNYFVCPDYDAEVGIQKANVNSIDYKYWESCETGKGKCLPLRFIRPKSKKEWFLLMPCGGTATSIIITGTNNTIAYREDFVASTCPPCVDLTKLKDGKYFVNMIGCGLGGSVEFNLLPQ